MLAAGYTATEWDVSMEKDAGKMLADLRTRGLRMLGRFVGLELRNPAKRAGGRYHPVVKAPGTNAYYLNFLARDVRKISPVNDPHYDWLTKNWDGNPIEIPVK